MEAASAPKLVASYLTAVYRVTDTAGRRHSFTFNPGCASPGDDPRLLPFAQPWAIITAWNPCSLKRSDDENRAAHRRLVDAVRGLHRRTHPSESNDPSHAGDWREEGVLIERSPLALTGLLLRVFRQNAAVYCAAGCIGLLFTEPFEWRVYPMRLLPEGQ